MQKNTEHNSERGRVLLDRAVVDTLSRITRRGQKKVSQTATVSRGECGCALMRERSLFRCRSIPDSSVRQENATLRQSLTERPNLQNMHPLIGIFQILPQNNFVTQGRILCLKKPLKHCVHMYVLNEQIRQHKYELNMMWFRLLLKSM